MMTKAMKVVRPPNAFEQSVNRNLLTDILRSEDLLSFVKVNIDGRQRAVSITWEEYWSPFNRQFSTLVQAQLETLRKTRRVYIQGEFSLTHANAYCHAYFSLLRTVLQHLDFSQKSRVFLQAILGFECAGLRWPDQSSAIAAVTSTVRNPNYLLSKIKQPDAYDDPKFLPQITVFNSDQDLAQSTKRFFHYRQVKVDKEGSISLLVYPAVVQEDRPDSFACIQHFTSGLSHKTDPRSRRRSRIISNNAISPFFQDEWASLSSKHSDSIKFADLGGGSGALLRGICESLERNYSFLAKNIKFDWTVVDVKFQKLRRHARNRVFRRHLSSTRWEQIDYFDWIQQQHPKQNSKAFDVILLCRLLNNLSEFSLGWVDDWSQIQKLTLNMLTRKEWQDGCYLPTIALSQESRATSEKLVVSNARVPLLRGFSYCQASLSDYYRGLFLLANEIHPSVASDKAIFFPIRRFNDSALSLPGGSSIINKLASIGHLLVIEDVDCTPTQLFSHLKSHKLVELAASDVTNRQQMRSSNLLCVSNREDQGRLSGQKFW